MAPKGKAKAKPAPAAPKAKAKSSPASPAPAGKAKAKAAPERSDADVAKERAEERLRECLVEQEIASVDGRVLEIALSECRIHKVDDDLLQQADKRYQEWQAFQDELKARADELRAQKAEAIARADEENEVFAEARKNLHGLKKRVEALFEAVEDSDIDKVRSWVQECVNTAEEGAFPMPPLPIDVEDHELNTPLSEAACYGEEEIVEFLLGQGAHPNCQNSHGKTPLWRATYNGHEAVVELLLKMGGNPTIENTDGEEAGKYGTPATKARIADWKKTSELQDGSLSALQRLKKPWPQLLLEATRAGDSEAALLIANAVPHAAGGALQVVRSAAEFSGPAALLRTVIDFENMADALWNACTRGHDELVRILISANANVDSFSDIGLTCLMIAARKGHSSIVKMLLEGGAKTHLRSDADRLASDYAREAGNTVHYQIIDYCQKIKDWSTLEEEARQSGGNKVCGADAVEGIVETRRNAGASDSATAELRAMPAGEIREGGDRYKQLLEERALADVLGIG